MNGNSRTVSSTQAFCHPRLGQRVLKHLQHGSQRPAAAHTRAAFDSVRERLEDSGRPLIFDSFCGTGMSTALIAQRHPDCLVLGVDQSEQRLDRHPAVDTDNYLLLRADCGDFWRLAAQAGWRLHRHYLLYPNPWPKPGHLQRRIHGSQDFPALLELGGEIELRSNWQVYAEEFGLALNVAGHPARIDRLETSEPLTLFEKKYRDSGHALWRCRCSLPQADA